MDKDRKPTYFLVDTENIGTNFSLIADAVKPGDTVMLLGTENNGKMRLTLDDLAMFTEKGADILAIRCIPGKNALDFQLASCLGWNAAKNPDCRFVVCSNDAGYRPLKPFWKKLGIEVDFLSTETPVYAPKTRLTREQCLKQYRCMLNDAGINGKWVIDSADAIMTCIDTPAKGRALRIRNLLQKQYDKATINRIWTKIQPVVNRISSEGPYPEKS